MFYRRLLPTHLMNHIALIGLNLPPSCISIGKTINIWKLTNSASGPNRN